MKHALVDLRTPDRFRLDERRRSLAANVLDRLLVTFEDDIRAELTLPAPAFGSADRLTVPKRYQRLLRAALERSNEHLLMLSVRAEEAPFRPDASPILALIADYPDGKLLDRAREYVVAESRRYDRFGEPVLPAEELSARTAASAAWLAAASVRKRQLRAGTADEAAVDSAIQAAVRQLLADRGTRTNIHWRAARLVARLARVGEVDDEFLTETFRTGQIMLFVAGLTHRAAVPTALIRRFLMFRDAAALAVMMRGVGIGESAAGAVLAALQAHELSPAPPLAVLYGQIEADAARLQLHRWRLDAGYARAIAALDEEAPS